VFQWSVAKKTDQHLRGEHSAAIGFRMKGRTRHLFRGERLAGLEIVPFSDRMLGMRILGENEPAELRVVSNWPALLERSR
jgi:hypothetical protein